MPSLSSLLTLSAASFYASSQRHLLQLPNTSLPITTSQFFYPTGLCDLGLIPDGSSGFVLQGEIAGDYSGISVSSAGDINGDGVSDIIVGAYGISSFAGKSYVVFGSRNSSAWGNGLLNISSLMNGQRGFVLQGEAAGDFSGSVSAASDINGDGVSDIIVGARGAASNAGKSYVVFGSRNSSAWGNGLLNLGSLMNGQLGFALQGEAAGDFSGYSVSAASDINGDGVSDIIVGAYGAASNAGKSYVLFGSSPFYFTSNNLQISVGETVLLTPQMLALASVNPGLNISTLPVAVDSVNGYFAFRSEPSVNLDAFYMQNISDGLVQFVHTGGALAPGYRVRLQLKTRSFFSDAQVDFLGYRPNLITNQLHVNQGLSTLVGSTDLSASDQDNGAKELSFIISNLIHGQFTIYNATANTSLNTTQFTQQDILDRKVQFVHDGSRNLPNYLVAVTDKKSTTNNQTASITFNYAPELNITSSSLILDQGQGTTLSPRDIHATDVETFADTLIISADNVTYGHFAYASNPNISISAFQQLSLTTGDVQFVQNGSDKTPTFALCVSDGILYSPWQTAQFYLNHRPQLQGGIAARNVTQGDDFNFDIPERLFNDPDANDTLTYSARLTGGAPMPVGISFTAPSQFSGNFPNTGSFNIEIQAKDKRGLTASTNFILTSEESKAAYYRSLYGSLSGVAGSGFALIAYLWLRRRIANHRRDFPFANDLRKVLNLEYYDFTRFDGDTYKTKINDFLQQLRLEHHEFYTQLTPAEQKSFAVCVAEILMARALISRSGYGGGLFGVLCCLNVGYPSQLNMKAFEKQIVDIAAEAVTHWEEAGDKAQTKWFYQSPSRQEKLHVFFCCAKPSTAKRFPPPGIELENLKQHEGASSALESKSTPRRRSSTFESKVMFFMTDTNRRMETMASKVDAMAGQIHDLEESRPLIEQNRR
ncbi:MAG: FG-GAP repeat protein [Legionella sp.]|nr:FG-GAP repeat protein [Legionella sp.]